MMQYGNKKNWIRLLAQYIENIRLQLFDEEIARMEAEINLFQNSINSLVELSYNELIKLYQSFRLKPLKYDHTVLIRRILDWSGGGCLESSINSYPLLKALKALEQKKNWRYWTGRGHVAPALYALQYFEGKLPLFFLASIGTSIGLSPILKKQWGAPSDTDFNLGVELPKALGVALAKPQISNVILLGDSELYSGFTLEALMLIRALNVKNIHLVIEANGFGISPLPKPISQDVLSPFFSTVVEMSTDEAIEAILNCFDGSKDRTALLVRNKKRCHSYISELKRIATKKETLPKIAGSYLKDVKKNYKDLTIISPDLAMRFNIDNKLLINVSLSEISSPLVLSRLSPPRILATDQKYLLNCYSGLRESAKEGKIIVFASKSWKQWGAAPEALNVLSLLPNSFIVEPASKSELKDFLFEALNEEKPGITIISLIDAESDLSHYETKWGHWSWQRRQFAYLKPLVVSFGYSSYLLEPVCKELKVDQLHTPCFRPSFPNELRSEIRKYKQVLVFEFNGMRGGFGEFFSRFNNDFPFKLYGVNAIGNFSWDNQLKNLGFDFDSLKTVILEAVVDIKN